MDDPGRLYPGLPEALDAYDPDEPLVAVGNFTARELVLEGADFQIGKEPKIEAECALVVWYDAAGNAHRPVLVEFSFRYENDHERYEGAVAERAYKVFQELQEHVMANWVDGASKTKTAFVYG
jgi:hypothetical protein